MDSVESQRCCRARPVDWGKAALKSLGDGVFFKHDEQQEDQDCDHGADERPERTQNGQHKGLDVAGRSQHFHPCRVGEDDFQTVEVGCSVLGSLFLQGCGDFGHVLNEQRQLLVQEDGEEVHRDDEDQNDGSVRNKAVADLGLWMYCSGGLDEEEQQDGNGQRHQNGFEVDEGEVHHHADDGHACRSCSLGVNANLCVHVHEPHLAQIASKVSSDSVADMAFIERGCKTSVNTKGNHA